MKGSHLFLGDRTHKFRGEIQRLVVEIESQPIALALVDVDIVAQHAKERLRLLDYAGQLVQRNSHASAIQLDANTQTRHMNLLNSGAQPAVQSGRA